jgi:hypothetical protein
MKKLIMILSIFLISLAGIAQQSTQDVIYLKNGTVVRGRIIEQVPNQSIKVYTANRSIVELQMNEIEKTEKETISGSADFLTSPDELPVSQGNMIISGSGSIDFTKNKYEYPLVPADKISQFGINLYPSVSYFIIDNLAVGAGATVSFYSSEGEKGYRLGIGPEVRYYFDAGLLLKAEFNYIFSHNPSDKDNYFSIKPGVGYAFFLNSKVSLEPCVVYEFSSRKFPADDYTIKTGRFGVEIALTIFL